MPKDNGLLRGLSGQAAGARIHARTPGLVLLCGDVVRLVRYLRHAMAREDGTRGTKLALTFPAKKRRQ